MAYAIIEMGGKQYRVEKGDSVVVDRLDAKEGAKVSPRALLYRSRRDRVRRRRAGKVKVEAVVTEHLKGEKIRVFKYRPKKRYRSARGHRSLADAARDQGDKRAGRRQGRAKKPAAAKAAPGSRRTRSRGRAKQTQEGRLQDGT